MKRVAAAAALLALGAAPDRPTAPRDCIATQTDRSFTIVDAGTVAYPIDAKRAWHNTLAHTCTGLDPRDVLMVETTTPQQACRGDLLRGIDRTTGGRSATCRLGRFTLVERTPR